MLLVLTVVTYAVTAIDPALLSLSTAPEVYWSDIETTASVQDAADQPPEYGQDIQWTEESNTFQTSSDTQGSNLEPSSTAAAYRQYPQDSSNNGQYDPSSQT
jgi:hypothetical protein